MNTKRAYKSFLARAAKLERMKKYNTKQEPEKKSMGGLLSRRSKEDTKSEETVEETIIKYIKVVREMAGGSNEE